MLGKEELVRGSPSLALNKPLIELGIGNNAYSFRGFPGLSAKVDMLSESTGDPCWE